MAPISRGKLAPGAPKSKAVTVSAMVATVDCERAAAPPIRITASIGADQAVPIRLNTATERIGPATRNGLGRHRSATWPKPSCDTDPAI